MNDIDLQKQARRNVAMAGGFAIHLLVYLVVNGALLLGGHGRGVALGWGLGLAIHGLVTLLKLGGHGLRQRLVDAEMRRLRSHG
jgi:hypothetical protein